MTEKIKEPQAGDKVEIHLMKEIYEGTLLESSELGIVLLKLNNGYNIGFDKKKISDIKLIERQEEKKKEIEIKKDSSKPNVAMIITGGTIASRYDSKTGGVKWLDSPENLFKFYPEMFEKVNVSRVEIPFMKGSESMDYKDWKKISKVVEDCLNDSSISGVIVTHGTDTLHYTSSALSFFLNHDQSLNKPVVLTYSQRSIDRASSDANLNLQCSAEVAGLSDIAEVLVVGHADSDDSYCYAMPGTKVKKLHTSKRDAFKVINNKPFAKVFPGKIEKIISYNLRKKGKIKSDNRFEEKVALVKYYPGQSPEILDFYLEKGYKGIVLEMTGLGHVATKESRNSWTAKLKEVQKKGLIVCGTSQCIFGRVDPLVYSNGRELLETGIFYLEDMLSETALVKLGWVLGHSDWNVKEKMLENISGELNKRLEY